MINYSKINYLKTSNNFFNKENRNWDKKIHQNNFRNNNYDKKINSSSKHGCELPVEREFYQQMCQHSVTSLNSVHNHNGFVDNNTEQILLTFEAEFSYQEQSDEPLYADYSKTINLTHRFTDFSRDSSSSNSSNLNIDGNSIYTTQNYFCNPDVVTIQDQPVVYIAIEWWANDLNQSDSKIHRPLQNRLV